MHGHVTSPRCAACRKPVTTECFLALNHAYHLPCFQCVKCQSVIDPDAMFYEKNGQPCCSDCILKARITVFQSVASPTTDAYRFHLPPPPAQEPQFSSASRQPNVKKMPFREQQENKDQADFKGTQEPATRHRQPNLPVPPPRRASQDAPQPKIGAESSTHRQPLGPIPEARAQLETPVRRQMPIDISKVRSLGCILADSYGVDRLIRFCMRETGLENVFFWMDIGMFHIQEDSQLMFWAEQIHEKY